MRSSKLPYAMCGLLVAAVVLVCSGASGAAAPRRAIELVSDPNKATPVNGGTFSVDGERVIYRLYGGTDYTSWGTLGTAMARRTLRGWRLSPVLPARELIGTPEAQLVDTTSDLSAVLIQGGPSLGQNPGARTLFRYEPESGRLERGVSIENASSPVTAISDDLRHVFGTLSISFAPQDTAGGLYDFGSGAPELISWMPGNIAAPSCGVSGVLRTEFAWTAFRNLHWVSTDGSRAFFRTFGDGDCFANPQNLYVRDRNTATTFAISTPPLTGPDTGGHFLQATPSGSQVFYTTSSQLDPSDTNLTNDVYRFAIGRGNDCLTCTLAGVPIEAEVIDAFPSEGGERVYFVSSKALQPGVQAGERNLYVWRADAPDALSYIAPSDGVGPKTPDGSVLVFVSSRPALNQLTGTDNGGHAQYYRYDDKRGRLECATCPTVGPAQFDFAVQTTGGAMFNIKNGTLITDDGHSFFFMTDAPILPQDVNDDSDIYEWHDGSFDLITDGRTAYRTPSPHSMLGVTGDGEDFFFTSYSALTPEASDETAHMYDARIGGGFPAQPPPKAACQEDSCQDGVTPPRVPIPSSVTFAGPSNDDVSERRESPRRSETRVKLGKRSVRGTRLTLAVRVSDRGRITVKGRQVRTARRSVSRAGTYRVTTTLTRRAKRALRRTGRLRVAVTVSFQPAGGPSRTVAATLTVRASRGVRSR